MFFNPRKREPLSAVPQLNAILNDGVCLSSWSEVLPLRRRPIWIGPIV